MAEINDVTCGMTRDERCAADVALSLIHIWVQWPALSHRPVVRWRCLGSHTQMKTYWNCAAKLAG